jgi:uncharacterized membrane protein YkgB
MNQENNSAFEPVDSKHTKKRHQGLNYNFYTQNKYYRVGNILALIEAIITLLASISVIFA